jgi:hypothetical protein
MFLLLLLGLTCGIAAMAVLSADQLEGRVPQRRQQTISWDA